MGNQSGLHHILWAKCGIHPLHSGELEKYLSWHLQPLLQMLPFTPISEELLRRDWIEEEFPILEPAKEFASEGWKGFIIMAEAILDKEGAWAEAQSLTAFDDGNSRSNTLYWIATRPQ